MIFITTSITQEHKLLIIIYYYKVSYIGIPNNVIWHNCLLFLQNYFLVISDSRHIDFIIFDLRPYYLVDEIPHIFYHYNQKSKDPFAPCL